MRRRADDTNRADGLVHGDGDIANRRTVDCAIELVGPGRIGEEALDAGIYFRASLFLANRSR